MSLIQATSHGQQLLIKKVVMRVFVLFLLFAVVGCGLIRSDGEQCNKADIQNCEIYIPIVSPLKLFVISAFN